MVSDLRGDDHRCQACVIESIICNIWHPPEIRRVDHKHIKSIVAKVCVMPNTHAEIVTEVILVQRMKAPSPIDAVLENTQPKQKR